MYGPGSVLPLLVRNEVEIVKVLAYFSLPWRANGSRQFQPHLSNTSAELKRYPVFAVFDNSGYSVHAESR